MKISTVAAMLSVAALSAVVLAQGPQGGPPRGGGMGGGMMGRGRDPKQMAERQTQMMTEMLKLTPAQSAKVKAILLKSAMDMKKIRDAQDAQLKKVFTPAQLKQVQSMRGPGGMGGGRRPGGR